MRQTHFPGLPCLELTLGDLSLLLTTSVGPRVLALRVMGENLFAELPEATLDHPDGRKFHLYGGHRLWYAPEISAVTYLPDDEPVRVEKIDGAVRLTQPLETGTGMQKAITVGFEEDGMIRVEHALTNRGDREIVCAPWAITQFKPGGTAILPLPERIPGFSDYQPNRALGLWPYTDITDPHLRLGNRFVFVEADRPAGALKIGGPNPDGWLAYHRHGLLFVKFATYDPEAAYFDLGASSQVYSNPQFLELETLGPKVTLRSGETTRHVETWRVYRDVEFDGTEAGAEILSFMLKK